MLHRLNCIGLHFKFDTGLADYKHSINYIAIQLISTMDIYSISLHIYQHKDLPDITTHSIIPSARTSSHQHSFYPRTIKDWPDMIGRKASMYTFCKPGESTWAKLCYDKY